MKKLFELHQKITLLVNEYQILKDTPDGKQELAGYARQKRLALREQFTLFANEGLTKVLATSKARSAIDLSPTFDVYDDTGKPLAVLKKEFKKSLLISTWSILDAKEKNLLFNVSEKSTAVAIGRRVWELVPYLSEFIPFPFKFHFLIKSGDQTVGEYTKIALIRDHYALHLDEKQAGKLDEKAWMVLAVLLDAMQSR